MNSRERVLAALDHQETDRIPIAMVCGGINPPAMQALDGLLLSLDMWEEFIKPYHVRINEMIHNMRSWSIIPSRSF